MENSSNTWSTILFADICRSTVLFDQLGDHAALELITSVLQLAARIAAKHSGKVIGNIGDEILCTFSSPEDALRAANQIHSEVQSHATMRKHQLAMRIGINSGPVLVANDNVHGTTVNIAARLAQQAKANQSLVSTSTLTSTNDEFSGQLRPIGSISLKGKAGMVSVHELIFPEYKEEITQVNAIKYVKRRSFLLTVRYLTRQKRLDPMLVRYLFGRSNNCDQVINHPTISREHAEILYRNGRFLLRDFSTNGSVIVQGNKVTQLHRTSIELKTDGEIYLGRTSRIPQFRIEFNCSRH
ncbi:MAG: adenylate/guanylate cyclase domain-containing protein [Xanthomonadales bacterium]|nr:adenylate/guanylate cyclase domain-containing protein [Xanthomonadales bacterium]